MKCPIDNCQNAPTVVPVLCIPAADIAIDVHKCFELIFGLECCDACFAKLNAQDYINHEVKKMTIKALHQKAPIGFRPAAPDYHRAFFTRLSIDSEKYQAFKAQVRGGINTSSISKRL